MTLAFLQSLIDLLTGSLWTYPILFGICVGDAIIPAFPERDRSDRDRDPGCPRSVVTRVGDRLRRSRGVHR